MFNDVEYTTDTEENLEKSIKMILETVFDIKDYSLSISGENCLGKNNDVLVKELK